MKFTNLSKLLIKFIGGGLVNFPTRYLKEVELEGEGGESEGGESGNDDELISNTKKIFAAYVNAGNQGETSYTEDNVELPDKYIAVNGTTKEIYEVASCCGIAAPLYLKNRSLNDNNIIINTSNNPALYKVESILDANVLVQNFINKTSLNLNDYISFKPKSIAPIG